MKKLLLISMLVGAMPLAMMAQDDDLYFVSKKKKSAVVEETQDQFGIRGRIVPEQAVEFGSFVHVVSVSFFHFVAVDQDDIPGDEFRINVTAVHIVTGINNSNGDHHGFVLLSVSSL